MSMTASSLLYLTQNCLLVHLWQVHQLLLRGHPHLHILTLPDVQWRLLQRGLMRADNVILGDLGQGGPQVRWDVGFYLFQLRIIKHRCLRCLGRVFTSAR